MRDVGNLHVPKLGNSLNVLVQNILQTEIIRVN